MKQLAVVLFVLLLAIFSSASETGTNSSSMRRSSHSSHQQLKVEEPFEGDFAASCRANRNVSDGRSMKVSTKTSWLCKRVPGWWSSDNIKKSAVGYSVSKSRGKIVVSTHLYFNYVGKPENKKSSVERLYRTRACVVRFYQRFGITLKLDYSVNSGWNDWWRSDKAMNLWDSIPRANSANWVMLETGGYKLSEDSTCSKNIHELGHTLGLPDLYPDPDCPDRATIGPDNNVMRNSRADSKNQRLSAAQVQFIIAPLCEGK